MNKHFIDGLEKYAEEQGLKEVEQKKFAKFALSCLRECYETTVEQAEILSKQAQEENEKVSNLRKYFLKSADFLIKEDPGEKKWYMQGSGYPGNTTFEEWFSAPLEEREEIVAKLRERQQESAGKFLKALALHASPLALGALASGATGFENTLPLTMGLGGSIGTLIGRAAPYLAGAEPSERYRNIPIAATGIYGALLPLLIEAGRNN